MTVRAAENAAVGRKSMKSKLMMAAAVALALSSGAVAFAETGGGSFTVGVVATAATDSRIGGKAATSGNIVLR